jgi:hypothetical protein
MVGTCRLRGHTIVIIKIDPHTSSGVTAAGRTIRRGSLHALCNYATPSCLYLLLPTQADQQGDESEITDALWGPGSRLRGLYCFYWYFAYSTYSQLDYLLFDQR